MDNVDYDAVSVIRFVHPFSLASCTAHARIQAVCSQRGGHSMQDAADPAARSNCGFHGTKECVVEA